MTHAEIHELAAEERAQWNAPDKRVTDDAKIAVDWIRKARRDVTVMIAAYNQLQREIARVRELLFWTTNPDFEVSFWDVCLAAGVEPVETRNILFKGIEPNLLALVKP